MIKRIFILLFLLLITAYLIVAVTVFNTKPADQTCKGMELIINDSIDHGFITQKEVLRALENILFSLGNPAIMRKSLKD